LIVRNAGGNAEAALATIIGVDTLVAFKDILVVKHTDCGGLQIRDDSVKEGLHKLAPHAAKEIDAMKFGEITMSLEEATKEDVAWLKKSELLRPELRERVFGYVYDLASGNVNPVV
jgi:carbonic anhydrase